jgi:hypothetical protein
MLSNVTGDEVIAAIDEKSANADILYSYMYRYMSIMLINIE